MNLFLQKTSQSLLMTRVSRYGIINFFTILMHKVDPRLDKVYGVQLEVKDYIEQKTGKPLENYEDYLTHPEKYQSNFHQKVIHKRSFSVLFNDKC